MCIRDSTYIAYCFHPVEGMTAVTTYVGTASNPGPFVYLGFRPEFLMLREYSTVDSWGIYDEDRLGYNLDSAGNAVLYVEWNGAEEAQATRAIDLLSNGFKLRTNNPTFNGTGNYLCLAFAKSPFKTSNAR